MHHPLHVNPHIGVLEPLDAESAAVAMREERERVARNLFEDGVVVVAGERHDPQDTPLVPVTARHRIES